MPSVTVGDSDLAYEQSGAGPDVVWIAGGGDNGASWRRWQTPAFDDAFRSTTFANRGVGDTVCRAEPPWTIADLAIDAAGLIEAVCEPPWRSWDSPWAPSPCCSWHSTGPIC